MTSKKYPKCKHCEKVIDITFDGLCYDCYDLQFWKRRELRLTPLKRAELLHKQKTKKSKFKDLSK